MALCQGKEWVANITVSDPFVTVGLAVQLHYADIGEPRWKVIDYG
jgi:hypothetical protein